MLNEKFKRDGLLRQEQKSVIAFDNGQSGPCMDFAAEPFRQHLGRHKISQLKQAKAFSLTLSLSKIFNLDKLFLTKTQYLRIKSEDG